MPNYLKCSILYSYQQRVRAVLVTCLCPRLIFEISHLVCVKYLMILICISLMTNDVEHLFMSYWPFVYVHWWSVCWSLCLFLVCSSFNCWFVILYIFGYKFFVRYMCCKYFSPICDCHFIFLMVYFGKQNFLSIFLWFVTWFLKLVSWDNLLMGNVEVFPFCSLGNRDLET